MNICCHCHGTFAGLYVSHKRHIIRISAYVTNNGTHGLTENENSRERMFLGANTLECESSRERKFLGHFALVSESSRKREGQGAKGPRREGAKKQKFQGANWPGSKRAVNLRQLHIATRWVILQFRLTNSQRYLVNAKPDTNHSTNPTNPNGNSKR